MEYYLLPKFTCKSVEKDPLLGATDGGMADKDNPKYDMFGGVELSGSFEHSAEDSLTIDFAAAVLQLEAQSCCHEVFHLRNPSNASL